MNNPRIRKVLGSDWQGCTLVECEDGLIYRIVQDPYSKRIVYGVVK